MNKNKYNYTNIKIKMSNFTISFSYIKTIIKLSIILYLIQETFIYNIRPDINLFKKYEPEYIPHCINCHENMIPSKNIKVIKNSSNKNGNKKCCYYGKYSKYFETMDDVISSYYYKNIYSAGSKTCSFVGTSYYNYDISWIGIEKGADPRFQFVFMYSEPCYKKFDFNGTKLVIYNDGYYFLWITFDISGDMFYGNNFDGFYIMKNDKIIFSNNYTLLTLKDNNVYNYEYMKILELYKTDIIEIFLNRNDGKIIVHVDVIYIN